MLCIQDELGGVGLAGLALEALEPPRAALDQKLTSLGLAYPLAGDSLPDGELAPALPGGAAVGLLRFHNRGAALRASPERRAVITVAARLYESGDLLTLLRDRKSTRLNSSHANISYAVFCLKKKKQEISI